MCGIAGILARAGERPDEAALRAMTAALVHRGPDGEGFFAVAPIALGHRRLAIIDVDGGAQPMHAAGGRVTGVVNGEIYNFAELRARLEARGHRFVSRSDSEVVVHGYAEWGAELVDRLDGMFALAVWDAGDGTLLLARDRMGEKPLYYAERDGALIFASELRALLRHPAIHVDVDTDALARYLVYDYIPPPRSILRGVHKLAAGEMLIARPGAIGAPRRYWELPLAPQPPGGRITELADGAAQLRAALERAVASRMVSDVPLGVFLSGGLDSSLVAALAARARGGDLDTFAIAFDDPSYDESAWSRRVAGQIGSRHHEHRVTAAELLALIPRLGSLLDEPLADGSLVPTHLLARFARERVTVALGGDGSDELFGGYPTFVAESLTGRALDRLPGPIAALLARAGRGVERRLPATTANFAPAFIAAHFLQGIGEHGARRHQAWMSAAGADGVAALLGPAADGAATADLLDHADALADHSASPNRWDRLLAFYAGGYLADDMLPKIDRASMAVSLEVRSPMLAREVVDLACRLAPSLRVRGRQTKRALRAAARGLVPDEVIDRAKHGFAMPIAGWLRGPLADFARDTLAPARLEADGLIDGRAAARAVDDHVAGRRDHRKLIWSLLAFQCWLDAARDQGSAVQLAASI